MTNAPHPQASASSLPGDADDVRGNRKPTDRRLLPKLSDLPIPLNIKADDYWSDDLAELAHWIGAYHVLLLCERMGGQHTYISRDPLRSPFIGILPADKIAVVAEVYGGSRYSIPTGALELRRARRAGVISAVRAGMISGRDGAIVLGTARSYMATLVNASSEGVGVEPTILPDPTPLAQLKRAASEATATLSAAGVNPAIVASVWAAIMAIWDQPASPPVAPSSPASDPVLSSFTDIEGSLHGA